VEVAEVVSTALSVEDATSVEEAISVENSTVDDAVSLAELVSAAAVELAIKELEASLPQLPNRGLQPSPQ